VFASKGPPVGGQTPLGSGRVEEFGAVLSSPAAPFLSSFFSSAPDLKICLSGER